MAMNAAMVSFRWLVAGVLFMCLANAEIAEGPAAFDSTPDKVDKEEIRSILERVEWAKEVSINIESVTECDLDDVLPNGCRHPIPVYPLKPRYVEWDFKKRYTVTWGNVDDEFPQQFQWKTHYCGTINKTLEKGQRQFHFTFNALAAELSKSECNYTMQEIQKLVNYPRNSIRVTQPDKPGVMLKGIGFFPILDDVANKVVRSLRYGVSWHRYRTESLDIKAAQQTTHARWLDSYSQIALGSSLVAIISFWLGTKFAKREQGRVQLK